MHAMSENLHYIQMEIVPTMNSDNKAIYSSCSSSPWLYMSGARVLSQSSEEFRLFNLFQLLSTAAVDTSTKPEENRMWPNVLQHVWSPFQHVRPMYCNVCREALSCVTRSAVLLNGLSCEGSNEVIFSKFI